MAADAPRPPRPPPRPRCWGRRLQEPDRVGTGIRPGPNTTRSHQCRKERLRPASIGKRHLHGMVVVLVLVDQHDGPLPIGPFDGVRGYQGVAILIPHVAGDLVELVNGIHGLHPLFGDHLRRQILRRIVSDAIVLVDREEAAAPPAGVPKLEVLSRQRDIVFVGALMVRFGAPDPTSAKLEIHRPGSFPAKGSWFSSHPSFPIDG